MNTKYQFRREQIDQSMRAIDQLTHGEKHIEVDGRNTIQADDSPRRFSKDDLPVESREIGSMQDS